MNKFGKVKTFQCIPKNSCEDDDEDQPRGMSGMNPMIHLPYFESSFQARRITAYLDEQIRESKYYRPLLNTMSNLTENDALEIHIDSYGGSLDGAVAIINGIENCDAKVSTIVSGVAASAASLVALASPNIFVGPYATMMIHSATFGSFGKQSDVISHASFIDKRVKTLMAGVYKDFLTDEEFAEVLMGREIWLTNEELIERLQRRSEIQKERYEAELQNEDEQNIELDDQPVSSKPRKSKK